jgi:hypothetical protein
VRVAPTVAGSTARPAERTRHQVRPNDGQFQSGLGCLDSTGCNWPSGTASDHSARGIGPCNRSACRFVIDSV